MEILNSKRFLLSYDSEMTAHVYRGAEWLQLRLLGFIEERYAFCLRWTIY